MIIKNYGNESEFSMHIDVVSNLLSLHYRLKINVHLIFIQKCRKKKTVSAETTSSPIM